MEHFKTYLKFKNFDKVTEFRLINMILVAIAMGLLGPIIITLKGSLLAVWVISMFSIISTLSIKTNNYMTKKYNFAELYKMGVVIHILIIVGACLYFVNPLIMVWLDSLLVIAEVMVFSAYSILLNNFITDYYPDTMNDFQVVRNSAYADGGLLGLFLITIITYFFSISIGLVVFIVFNFLFSIWMILKWNYLSNELSKL